MPQLYPNPVSSTSGITINVGGGLSGGGPVPLNGSVTITGRGIRQSYTTSPAADGIIGTFNILGPVPSGNIDVFVAGKLQSAIDDYTLSGTAISFVTPPTAGQIVSTAYAMPSDPRQQSVLSPAAGVGVTTFGFPGPQPNATYIDVYVGGVLQTAGVDYTFNYLSTIWTVVFTAAPAFTPVAVFQPDDYSDRLQYALSPEPDNFQTSFRIVGGTPQSLYVDVYDNGSFQDVSLYNLNLVAGTWKVEFGTAPAAGHTLLAVF